MSLSETCTNSEVQHIIDGMEHRLRNEWREDNEKLREDIDASINLRINHFKPSPETDLRLKSLEGWRKAMIAFFVSNVVLIITTAALMGSWASDMKNGIDRNNERIGKLLEWSENVLIQKDASTFDEKIKAIDKRLERVENHSN